MGRCAVRRRPGDRRIVGEFVPEIRKMPAPVAGRERAQAASPSMREYEARLRAARDLVECLRQAGIDCALADETILH